MARHRRVDDTGRISGPTNKVCCLVQNRQGPLSPEAVVARSTPPRADPLQVCKGSQRDTRLQKMPAAPAVQEIASDETQHAT